MIKAILFDVDGVLVNGELFSVQFERDFGFKIPVSFFEEEFQPALVGKADLKELLKPKLADWGWKKSVDELLEYWFNIEHVIDEELIGAVKRLKARGIKCFVVTNQENYRARYIAEKMGFESLFDGFFASAQVGYKKPQVEFFRYILGRIELPGDEVLYFDDSPGYLEGAKSEGIRAYLYEDFERFKKVLNQYNLA